MPIETHADRHICVVLGKKLINGRPTCEFRDRIRRLVKSDPRQFHLIVFCGGGDPPEARVGLDEFRKQLSPDSPATEYVEHGGSGRFIETTGSRIPVFLGDRSMKAVEIVEAARDCLAHEETRSMDVEIISSDYHVERFLFVDEHMPEQSLPKMIRDLNRVDGVRFLRAPYHYEFVSSTVSRWLGKIYRLNDRLTVMRVNLEGLFDLKLDGIVPAVAADFRRTIDRIKDNLADEPEGHEASTDIRVVKKTIGRAIRLLDACASSIEDLSTRSSSGFAVDDWQKAGWALTVLVSVIERVKALTDPDEPIDSA